MLLNKPRALSIMQEFGIDALLATTPVNLAYLSDFTAWHHWFYRLHTTQNYWAQNYALLFADGNAAFLPSFESLAYVADSAPTWIEQIYAFGPAFAGRDPEAHHPPALHRLHEMNKGAVALGIKSAGEAVVRALKDQGISKGVVGVDTVGMQPQHLEYVRRELPDVQFKEAGELYRLIRMVKTPEEIERLRRAAQINNVGFDALKATAVPGATEVDLARAYRAAVSLAGAIPVFCNNPCGPFGITQWEPRPYVLQPGDTVYCDAGCTYENYHADGNIVAVLGEPTATHRQMWDSQMDGILAAMEVAKPGVAATAVAAALEEGETRSGTVKRSFGFGHALGLEARDFPYIGRNPESPADDFLSGPREVIVEPGMVFNLESVQRKVGIGTVAVEVTVLTTTTGCEFLSPVPTLDSISI